MEIKAGKYYMPSINYGISNDTCYIYSMNNSYNKEEFNYIKDKYNIELITLSLFLRELYKHGIGKIKVVSYIPLRPLNSNVLDIFKYIDTLFDNVVIINNPFEYDEYMNVGISEFNNDLIDKLIKE